jgi:hypothetical protein
VLAKTPLINPDKTRGKASPSLFSLQNENSVSILQTIVQLEVGKGFNALRFKSVFLLSRLKLVLAYREYCEV